MYFFIGLILIHISLVILLHTSWVLDVVWFTNIVSATLYLPLLLFSKIGLPVFEKTGTEFPGLTFLGWFLISLFWIAIYWGITRMLERLIAGYLNPE